MTNMELDWHKSLMNLDLIVHKLDFYLIYKHNMEDGTKTD